MWRPLWSGRSVMPLAAATAEACWRGETGLRVPGIGENGGMDEVRAGRLLVATPMLGDPNFKRTVVLVVEDEPEEGTLGVVLNRPTKVPVGRVLEPWTELVSDPSVVFKG